MESKNYQKQTALVDRDSMNDVVSRIGDREARLLHHSIGIAGEGGELVDAIKKHIPEFEIDYKPDYRQDIADTWPKTIDDSAAREEWGWKHEFDLDNMVEDMLKHIKIKFDKGLY